MEAIREELARNAAALSDIRTSQIFAGGSTDHLPGRDAHEALEEAATARAREEGLARDSETAALRAEVAELKAALAAEQERTQRARPRGEGDRACAAAWRKRGL